MFYRDSQPESYPDSENQSLPTANLSESDFCPNSSECPYFQGQEFDPTMIRQRRPRRPNYFYHPYHRPPYHRPPYYPYYSPYYQPYYPPYLPPYYPWDYEDLY